MYLCKWHPFKIQTLQYSSIRHFGLQTYYVQMNIVRANTFLVWMCDNAYGKND